MKIIMILQESQAGDYTDFEMTPILAFLSYTVILNAVKNLLIACLLQ